MRRNLVSGALAAAALAATLLVLATPRAADATPAPTNGPSSGGTTVSDDLPKVSFAEAASGLAFTVGLGTNGELVAWGENTFGQLGDGTTSSRATPAAVHFPAGMAFRQVVAGENFAIALADDGSLYAWGQNTYGQLGDGTSANASTPVRVATPAGTSFTAVGAGGLDAMAIAADGTAYAWGANGTGQLGDGTTTDRTVPVEVVAPAGVGFSSIALGQYHSLAIGSDGEAYAWGSDLSGQLGDGSGAGQALTPVAVPMPAGVEVRAVAAGISHSVALASDGAVYAWGSGGYGQLGDGSAADQATPVRVQTPAGATFTGIFAGGHHSGAVASDGQVYAWGDNRATQLGDGSIDDRSTPVRVVMPTGVGLDGFSANTDNTSAVGGDGDLYAWGSNGGGQLAVGAPAFRSVPDIAAIGTAVTAVAFGDARGSALDYDGVAWTVVSPPGCGPVPVTVAYIHLGQALTRTTPGGFVYGTAAAINGQPRTGAADSSGVFSATVTATGDPAPAIQWQSQTGGVWTDLPAQTGATLTARPAFTTSYRAVATNCFGAVVSDAVTATVATAPADAADQAKPAALADTGSDISGTGPAMLGTTLLAIGAAAIIATRRTRLGTPLHTPRISPRRRSVGR